jgi:gluconate 2-dehydrogenase alpha chain
MTERHPEVDVVIVGTGWAGAIMAAELGKAGLDVVALERGPRHDRDRGDFDGAHDELRWRRRGLTQDTAAETWTLRHDRTEAALPLRYVGPFTPVNAVGGSSLLYGAHAFRMRPRDFVPRTTTIERHGAAVLPADSTLVDWGITYDDLEPAYDAFERMAGIGGIAGNLGGEIQPAGNPFEGPRSADFPVAPVAEATAARLFRETAEQLGYHPYPLPGGTLSEPYVNPDGIARPACTYCGFCNGYPCRIGAKAEPTVTVLPVAEATGHCEVRAGAHVFRVLHDGSRATGVRYRDQAGEVHEQRAAIVILAAYALNNVRLLLLSGMGAPYDPATGTGVIGRNYSYHAVVRSYGLFADRRFERYMSSGTTGYCIDDYAADVGEGRPGDFIGGGEIWSLSANGGPLGEVPLPLGTPRWGEAWKRATHAWYDRAVTVGFQAEVLPYRDHHLDLDPRYRDAWGEPLLRITFDWQDNERKLTRFLRSKAVEIIEAMGPDHVIPGPDLPAHFDTVAYSNTHNLGGAIMGTEPSASAVNPFLQMWDYDNVWVVGGSAFPHAPAMGPTGTICALAYRAADAVKRYARTGAALA